MSLVDVRDAIASTLAARVPGQRAVESHGGTFSEKELKRLSLRLPCLLVTCLGAASVQRRGGVVSIDARWAAWVLAKDEVSTPRGNAALVTAELVARLVSTERWGRDDVGPASEVRGENLFSGELDKMGTAVWVVTWRQSYEAEEVVLAELADLLRVHVEYDAAPADTTLEAWDDVELEEAG